jgi:3-oxoacyl-[acyl-carrier protein] reductase
MPDLSGKVALVTGSTHGIGLAIASHMVAAGADVVVNSRSAGKARDVASGRAVGIEADVRVAEACVGLVEGAVEAFGRLDVLVNNAGVGIMKPVHELSLEDWHEQIGTNLNGVFYCSRAAVPHLKATGDGWIVNIGSLASRNSFAGGAAYNASKFGLLGMSEAMMLDLRYQDIRVSIVMPGSVETDFGGGSRGRTKQGWALHAEDVALTVMQLLELPPRALVSRVEMRPTKPQK